MAPKWPQVNNGPEHINEHAAYLREACNQLQAVDRGRQNQVPWNIVHSFIASTIALAGKVLQQPAMSEILHHIQDTAKCTQNIQRDVSVIKNSVGTGTAPLNSANFSGGRAAAATWAQVAARVNGPHPIPPPIPSNARSTKTQPTVTAYKDRAVTVKLKDHGISQRFRTLSTVMIKHKVEASIRENTGTKSVEIVAAHQLKSGDIQIFTSSTAEATKLREHRGWISGLGEHAELIVPTYGVIVHGISTNSINVKDQKATIQHILADNHTVIPKAEISYIGWLTRESPLKRASSIVVEFKDPEMANAIIYTGMAWEGQIHICQLYDRACRIKQCFRCYNYGHIGAQCDAAQTCGYCAELHETKNCGQKGVEGFTPKCTVCKGVHTAWSNACPERKKEMGRVEQAKQTRNTYWPVFSKEELPKYDNKQATRRRTRNPDSNQAVTIPDTPTAEPPGQATNTLEPPMRQAGHTAPEPHAPPETRATPAPIDIPSVEEWATPATQQEDTEQHPLIDPQILATEPPPAIILAEDDVPALETNEITPADAESAQPSLYPLDGIQEEFSMDDADAWLANIAINDGNDWLPDTAETDAIGTEISPPTSMATDTRTAQGKIYKACRCPRHQDIYDTWPTRNANLVIATCMKICTYCGRDCTSTTNLRKHMIRSECSHRNLEIIAGKPGRGSATTPGWTHREPETGSSQPATEPLGHQPNARTTRSQALTHSATTASR